MIIEFLIVGTIVIGLFVAGCTFLIVNKRQELERRILLLAERMGRVRFVDVVRECNIPPDKARELLDQMGVKGHLSMQVTKDGAMVYRLADAPAEIEPIPGAPPTKEDEREPPAGTREKVR